MDNTKGRVIQKNGKAYWVSNNAEGISPQTANRNQMPENVKIIPMGKLTRDERDILRDAFSYIHLPEYYNNKHFLENYRKFHKSTGAKYIDGGFEKFKVACIQARRIWT